MTRFGAGTAIALLLLSLGAQAAPVSEPVTIWSDGVRMAGNLWRPEGIKEGEKRPAVLLVHGWGGLKSHLNQAYAPQFAALGYVVLTFDYRGWGESDGKLFRVGSKPPEAAAGAEFEVSVREVRTIVDPLDQLEDVRAAHAYLVGDAQVDPARLAIWGSSLGGGLALQSAATLHGVRVLITQIGNVNPAAGFTNLAPDNPLAPTNILRHRSAVSRGQVPPFPGKETELTGLTGFPDWARFVRYDPFAHVDALTAATLIIDAIDEELFDIKVNGAELYARIKDRVPAKYETLPGKHYDLYRGAGYESAMKLEQAWLQQHLPPR